MSDRPWREGPQALAVSIAWMLAVQLACVVLWDGGRLTQMAALVHWVAIGVLPPALALITAGQSSRAGGAGG